MRLKYDLSTDPSEPIRRPATERETTGYEPAIERETTGYEPLGKRQQVTSPWDRDQRLQALTTGYEVSGGGRQTTGCEDCG